MLNNKSIPCQIINTQHQILLMCNTQSIQDNQDKSLIKQFIREVEVPDEYFNDIKELHNLAIEYYRVTAKNAIFSMENSQTWIQSSDICELTYVLKWVREKENLKGNQHFLPEIKGNNSLKTMIILNIAFEIEHQYTVQQLLQILTDNSEIFYLITQFFLRIIDDCTFDERQQFLLSLQKQLGNNAQNQLCFFKLLLQIYCSYSNELQNIFPKFSAESLNNLIKWEDYTAFLIEQQRFPILYERKSKIVYAWTTQNQEEEYNQFSTTFASELESFKAQSLKDLLTSEIHLQDEEFETNLIMKSNRIDQRRRRTVHSLVQSNKDNQTQSQIAPKPRAPPPLLPTQKQNVKKEFPILHLEILNGSIANTVWSEVKVVPTKEQILNRFKAIVREKKPKAQQQDQQLNTQVKTYLGGKGQKVELIRFQLQKIDNFQEILTQIENFKLPEFEGQEEDEEQNQVLQVNSLSAKIIQSLMQLVKDLETLTIEINGQLKMDEEKQQKTSPDLPKIELNENDKLVLRLFQVNSQKAIEIYNFWFNHLEDSQLIESRVTQYRDVLKSLKTDKQLIYYLSYLIQYAKKFSTNPALSGVKFSQLLSLSYKTQDANSEELSSIIVSEMRQAGIVFTNNELLQLEILSDEKNTMSQVESYIQRYSAQIKFLETQIENNEAIRQNQIIERFLCQYKEFKELIEVIYNHNKELYHELRVFYGDDLKPKETHIFFQEILSIKKQLLIYNQKIEERETVQRRQQLKKLRENGKIHKQKPQQVVNPEIK